MAGAPRDPFPNPQARGRMKGRSRVAGNERGDPVPPAEPGSGRRRRRGKGWEGSARSVNPLPRRRSAMWGCGRQARSTPTAVATPIPRGGRGAGSRARCPGDDRGYRRPYPHTRQVGW